MREYYRGWTRKLRITMLVVTLTVLVGWSRSYSTQDNFEFRLLNRPLLIKSDGGGIQWLDSPSSTTWDWRSSTDPKRLQYPLHDSFAFEKGRIVIPYAFLAGTSLFTTITLLLWKRPPRARRHRSGDAVDDRISKLNPKKAEPGHE